MYIAIYNKEGFMLLRSTLFVVYPIYFYDIIVLHYIIKGINYVRSTFFKEQRPYKVKQS